MIPLDVYGATIETTMADLRLLAALGGMQPTADPAVLARTRCGEMLVHSRHLVLGRMVYYRSDVLPRLTKPVPITTSRILQYTLAVHNHLAKRMTAASTSPSQKPTLNPSHNIIAALLSRPRTEFDAQIHCSQGDLAWLFTIETFKILSNGLQSTDLGWAADEARVFLGPLGQGVGGCSCLACCREWTTRKAPVLSDDKVTMSNEQRKELWPALEVWVTESGSFMTQSAGAAAALGKLMFSVAGMNTRWLGKCSKEVLDEVADSLADWVSEQDWGNAELRRKVSSSLAAAWGMLTTKAITRTRSAQPAQTLGSPKGPAVKVNVDLVRAVMAYTEVCLKAVRTEIGSSGMWEGPATDPFDDFGPVVLGA
ncbi:hypothetical protein C8A05DRAFT_36662 [Staphylotrichum tortipilum]|uniref:Uncharacterized protein n=1 Tax=Staphylotrichum tortipilum TaxID=2831512 RepID=A0AAN6MFR2_9PEZI|nr:hypothetical protein C8A05DRAFT_36662 [Staphylotrichum longicolle]